MSKFKILFQLTGSIACYKACQVISQLVQNQCEVKVAATPSTLKFVGEATIEGLTGQPVLKDLYQSGQMMDHIHLIRWADLIIVAPATANFINKISAGIGDDLLTTFFLAHDFKKPFLIAPAMNHAMLMHPTTQNSLGKLRDMGIQILEGAPGSLACGETGMGRLMEPNEILKNIFAHLKFQAELPRVLITGGGTQEKIDPVRRLTNISTGRTAAQIAETLSRRGFQVTYLHGENAQVPAASVRKIQFSDFSSLATLLTEELSNNHYDWVIQAAAISDYSVVHSSEIKLSSAAETIQLQLVRNPKLIDQIKSVSKNTSIRLIGFKLTAGRSQKEIAENIQKVFSSSKADLVVHNDLSEMKTGHPFHIYESLDQMTTVANPVALAEWFAERMRPQYSAGSANLQNSSFSPMASEPQEIL